MSKIDFYFKRNVRPTIVTGLRLLKLNLLYTHYASVHKLRYVIRDYVTLCCCFFSIELVVIVVKLSHRVGWRPTRWDRMIVPSVTFV